MAYSYVDLPFIGVGQTYSIPFPYLLASHVEVTIGGVIISPTKFTISGGYLTALSGFPSGAGRIRRRTPLAAFGSVQNGTSSLDWEGMTNNFVAVLYILQELIDSKDDNAVLVDGLLDDVASVLPVATSAASSSTDSAARALASEVAALAAKVLAETAASTAQSSATSSLVSASEALGSAQTAVSASTQASALVAAATAGFVGFAGSTSYDFGSVADPITYFNQDWGSI